MTNEYAIAVAIDILSVSIWPVATMLAIYRLALSIDTASIAVTRYFNLLLEQITSPPPPPVHDDDYDTYLTPPSYSGSILD